MADRKLTPSKTALLILELQNDVISEGGAFASSGAPAHAQKQNLARNVKILPLPCDRSARLWSISITSWNRGSRAGAQCSFVPGSSKEPGSGAGTWAAAPVDGLDPKPGDFVVEKMRMNAFYGTRLDPILRGRGIETLVITGAWSNFSVDHTARHGADAGYESFLPSDGTSTSMMTGSMPATSYALQDIAERLTCDEIIRALN